MRQKKTNPTTRSFANFYFQIPHRENNGRKRTSLSGGNPIFLEKATQLSQEQT
jgi:hypothetical protein